MPVTQTEIAHRLGLSQNTVSKALRGHPRVSESVRQRVLDAANRLGYQMNMAARAMVKGRFERITLLIGTSLTRSLLPSPLIDSLLNATMDAQLQLQLVRMSDEKLTNDRQLTNMAMQWNSDGVIVNYPWRMPETVSSILAKTNIPTVYINRRTVDCCVYPDEVAAGAAMAKDLLTMGCRNPVYLDPSNSWDSWQEEHFSVIDRARGFAKGMHANGHRAVFLRPEHTIGYGDYFNFITTELATECADGVACVGADTVAMVVAAGIAPQRIVAIDDQPIQVPFGGISTYVVPYQTMAAQAVTLIETAIDNDVIGNESQVVPLKLFQP